MRIAATKAVRYVAEKTGRAKRLLAAAVLEGTGASGSSSDSEGTDAVSAERPVGFFDDMSAFSFSLEATPRTNIAQETDEVLAEMADFNSLTQVNFRCGFNFRGQFDPAVFWANNTIMLRFPLHTVVARSYLSAMLHEATCERKFSYTGRVPTKERQTIDAEQVCASAVCVAGEAVYEMSPNEIKKTLREQAQTEGGGRVNLPSSASSYRGVPHFKVAYSQFPGLPIKRACC